MVTTDNRRSQLISEPNYWATKGISENLVAMEMKKNKKQKTKVKMNKPIYLGFSILNLRKIVMYEFWYEYMKPKYVDNVKLCHMDTDSFLMHIKTKDLYEDIADDVEKRFDTSNYEANRLLSTEKK